MLQYRAAFRIFILANLLTNIFISSSAFASEIVLKSGQKIEGKIIEQTDKYVKIDTAFGVPMTYYTDEIKSVVSSFEEAGDKEPPAAVDDHALFDFKLGGHQVDGNKIEFNFQTSTLQGQSVEGLFMNEGFYNNWSVGSYKKVKLAVDLYDHTRKLIYTGESTCVDMAHPMLNLGRHVMFPPIGFDVTRDQLKNIGYFSVATRECGQQKPPEDSTSQGVFAKKVLAAIKQGKEPYFSLFLVQPKPEEKDQQYAILKYFINNMRDVKIQSIEPMEVQDVEKYKNICSKPFILNIGGVENNVFGGRENKGGQGSGQIGLPVGKVGGEWKILYVESK